MKLTSFTALLLATGALAADVPRKQVIVSYPSGTDQSVVDDAIRAIKAAGGIITHEYDLIKGFAATASEQALATVRTLGQSNSVVIEEDQVIGITDV